MTQAELKDALAQTTQYDRDLLEKIITQSPSYLEAALGHGEYKAIEEALQPKRESLARLRNLGLLSFYDGLWHYVAGPISDFFALRIVNNFS